MLNRKMTGTALVTILAASSLLLVGCGSSSSSSTPSGGGGSSAASSADPSADNGVAALPAEQILAAAKAAADTKNSVHMAGTVAGNAFDLIVTKSAGSSGTLTIGGNDMRIIVSGESVYLKASADFWTTFGGSKGAATAALVGDKWVKASTSTAAFSDFLKFDGFLKNIDKSLTSTGSITKGDTSDLDGTPVIALVDNSPTNGGTLLVATTGEPLPLKLMPATSASSGTDGIKLSDWGTATPDAIPDAASVLDISQFQTAGQ
jgi:hypothetical protein